MIFQKIEKLLFYLYIFFIPLNVKLFLWQSGDLNSDFNKFFLYATDILIFGFLSLWILRKNFHKTSDSQKFIFNFQLSDVFLFIFGFFALISFAKNPAIISGYFLIKLFLTFLVYFYVKLNKNFLNLRLVFWIFIAAAVFQSVIADSQFHLQQNVGLKILGEAELSTKINGVAEFLSDGIILMRSYGTLPHPNILAAILFAAILLTIYLYAASDKKNLILKIFYSILFFILTLGLWLAFSRIGIILFLISTICLSVFLFFKFKNSRQKIIFSTIILLAINCSLFFVFNKEISARFSINPNEQAVELREFYNKEALEIISANPMLGIGPGNFINALKTKNPDLQEWLYQPAHNIFILILSETGIFGLFFFLLFIFSNLKETISSLIAKNRALYSVGKLKNELSGNNQIAKYVLLFIFFGFIIWGLEDHFFWTIEQGRLLFWLTLGLLARND